MNNGFRYLSTIFGLLVIAYCAYTDMPFKKMFAVFLVLWALDYLIIFLSGAPHPGYEFKDDDTSQNS